MPKTFLYKLFGLGKMPEEFKNGMEYFEEGIKVTVTYRGYRAPGKYFSLRKRWYSGALGYSKKGIIGIIRKQKFIDVPFERELYQKLRVDLTKDCVSIAFSSQDFNQETLGDIELRFYVEDIEKFQKLIQ